MRYLSLIVALVAPALLGQTDAVSLNQGIRMFKSARYAEAVAEFQRAVASNPNEVTPHLYLGTTYLTQWIPGADSPENASFASKAEAEFQEVLRLDPSNRIALASLSSLAFNQANSIRDIAEKLRKFEEAERWNQQLIQADPNNKEAYYSLGVIAWQRFYPEYSAARSRLGMRPEDPGPIADMNTRQDLKNRFGAVLENGLQNLTKALEIDRNYDDAMAYMNLLIREGADLRDTLEEYRRDVQAADGWVQKALETKRARSAAMSQPSQAPPDTQRIRVGSNVQAANLVNRVQPVYPPLAMQARIQGTVKFSVVIGKDGHVTNVQLLSGHPLLVPSAVEAVKQWVYKPTLLNGQPVEVATQIDVPFTLQ